MKFHKFHSSMYLIARTNMTQRCAAKMGAYTSFSSVVKTNKKLERENLFGHVLHPDQKPPFNPSAKFISSATKIMLCFFPI